MFHILSFSRQMTKTNRSYTLKHQWTVTHNYILYLLLQSTAELWEALTLSANLCLDLPGSTPMIQANKGRPKGSSPARSATRSAFGSSPQAPPPHTDAPAQHLGCSDISCTLEEASSMLFTSHTKHLSTTY